MLSENKYYLIFKLFKLFKFFNFLFFFNFLKIFLCFKSGRKRSRRNGTCVKSQHSGGWGKMNPTMVYNKQTLHVLAHSILTLQLMLHSWTLWVPALPILASHLLMVLTHASLMRPAPRLALGRHIPNIFPSEVLENAGEEYLCDWLPVNQSTRAFNEHPARHLPHTAITDW
jgi:hypothetical protein